MQIRDVLPALRSGWWLWVAVGLLGAVTALVVSQLTTPLYTSSIRLFVSATGSTSASEVFQGSQFSQQRVTSYAEVLRGEELAARVVRRLDLDETPEELRQRITVATVPQTVILDVSVQDSSPEAAQQIAGALSDEFIRRVTELEATDTGGVVPVKITVSDGPDLPDGPSVPRTRLNVAVGLFAGLLIGGILAVARARFDRTVKDPEEAVAVTGSPVVGLVVEDRSLGRTGAAVRGRTDGATEDYRRLRVGLRRLPAQEEPRVVLCTSPLPSQGTTTTVVNLGLSLAEAGRRVTVVDADLRDPAVARYLKMADGPGLADVLTGGVGLDDVVQRRGPDGLRVIGAGSASADPGEVLTSDQMGTVLDKLRAGNDYVLIDAPPVLSVADATAVTAHVDGVLFAVRYGRVRSEQLLEAAEAVELSGAHLLGVVLTMVPRSVRYRSRGYGHESADDHSGAHRA